MANMTLATEHADRYWCEVCEDGRVMTKHQAIVIRDEYQNFKLDPSKWMAVFLKYTVLGKSGLFEGLFFVEQNDSRAAKGVRRLSQFMVDNFDNHDGTRSWHFICSWRDAGKDNIRLGIEPQYTGLNDCAHFVSECLSKAGLKVASTDVGQLVSNCQAAGAKTLCYQVDKDAARRILQAGIVKAGDVLAFGTSDKKLHHSVLSLGDEKIAMHTYINHPEFDNNSTLVEKDATTGKVRNWETAANAAHPLVTILHFPFADKQLGSSPRVGWWKVTWRREEYYYYLHGDGRAGYLRNPPKTTKQPLVGPQATGFWFETDSDLVICWSGTGSVETYPLSPRIGKRNPPSGSSVHASLQLPGVMDGRWNDTEDLSALRPKAY